MMSSNNKFYIFLLLALLVSWGCEKKESFVSEAPSDYLKLELGKWIRYRYDSTTFIFYGQKDTVVKYQAKDIVEDSIWDNSGRKAWKIVRYLSDSAGIKPWKPISTYFVVPSRESIEWVENNFRYLKLKLPIVTGFSWKGNTFIDTYSINSEVRYLDNWDYKYAKLNQEFTAFNNLKIANTVTVEQRDETIGNINNPSVYCERTFSQEVWGKGLGLVYKEFLHWEYQPPNGSNPGYKNGYGVKMQMIDHN